MEKNELLRKITADEAERLTLAHLLDRWERCRRRNIPADTQFLTPQEQSLARELLLRLGAGEEVSFSGGYGEAERRIALFLPDYLDAALYAQEEDYPLCAVRCTYRPEDRPTHRDFLGSLMGLGIRRDMVGDILVTEGGCDILLKREILPFVLQNYTGAGRVRLKVAPVSLENRAPAGAEAAGDPGYGGRAAAGQRAFLGLPHQPHQGGGSDPRRPGGGQLAGVRKARPPVRPGRCVYGPGIWKMYVGGSGRPEQKGPDHHSPGAVSIKENAMIDEEKIQRINALARKAKSPEGLTEAEVQERAQLRQEYVAAVRMNLQAQLENTYIMDEQGNKRKLHKKKGGPKQ